MEHNRKENMELNIQYPSMRRAGEWDSLDSQQASAQRSQWSSRLNNEGLLLASQYINLKLNEKFLWNINRRETRTKHFSKTGIPHS